MRQGAQGWCTGMTQRNGMGRDGGGGFRMGNTYTPMVDSCQCMAKPIQYCKVKTKQNKVPLKKLKASFQKKKNYCNLQSISIPSQVQLTLEACLPTLISHSLSIDEQRRAHSSLPASVGCALDLHTS